MIRMEVHKLVRSILSGVLQQDLTATRVVVQPLCDIINIALNNDPGRGFYFELVFYDEADHIPEVCCLTSSRVILFDIVVRGDVTVVIDVTYTGNIMIQLCNAHCTIHTVMSLSAYVNIERFRRANASKIRWIMDAAIKGRGTKRSLEVSKITMLCSNLVVVSG